MRELYCVPMVHDVRNELASDFGRLHSKLPEDQKERYEVLMEEYWSEVDEFLGDRTFDRVYCDGLSSDNGSAIYQIVRMAMAGSDACKRVLKACEEGGSLERTESSMLLKMHWKFHWLIPGLGIKMRDWYAHRQIDKTLLEDEVGVLFMGYHHGMHRRERYEDIVFTRMNPEACSRLYSETTSMLEAVLRL